MIDVLFAILIVGVIYFAGFILFVPSLGNVKLSPGKALRRVWGRLFPKREQPPAPPRHHRDEFDDAL